MFDSLGETQKQSMNESFRRTLVAAIAGLTICAAAAAAAAAATAAPAANPISTAGVDAVFQPFTQPATAGCSTGVFEHGKPLLMRGYGAADIEKGAPLKDDTLFYAASTSKQFTALSVALLAQQGKLQLGDDIRKYIPEMPDYGTPLTIAMLLHHTSGLGDYLSLFELAGTAHYETLDPPAVLRMITRQKGVQFTPGTRFRYSNTGYFLLAQIVERVSKQPFPEFIRTKLLLPLGMKDSFMRGGQKPSDMNVAHGYVPEDHRYIVKDTYPAFGGSGGLMTSIRDLQKFDRDFHIGHRIWTDAVRKTMLEPGRFNDGTPVKAFGVLYYAAGLEVGTQRGLSWVSHSGAAAAFRSEYVRLPDLGIGIAVLCNRGDAKPGDYVQQIIDSLGIQLSGSWEAPGKREADAFEAAKPLPEALVAALQGRFHSDELLADYVFAKGGDGRLAISVQSNHSSAPAEAPFSELRLLSDDVLAADGFILNLRRPSGGAVQSFTLGNDDMHSLLFERVPAGSSP